MLSTATESMGQMLATRANTILKVCSNFLITDQASYSEADRKVSETASLEKGIKEYWAEPKLSAHKTWKGICQKEKDMLTPIQEGSRFLSIKMATFKREFDLAEQKKRDELADKAKKELQLKAFELAEQGVDPIAVEAIVEMAEDTMSTLPVAEIRGKTTFVRDYEVRIVPGKEHLIPQDILQPTTPQMVKALEAKIKKLAKLNGGKKIEGVEIIPTQSTRRRTI
tara:strand:- start:1635 stop:2309 length:675 start_codon:yes stop_codon:yes gene_type:complete